MASLAVLRKQAKEMGISFDVIRGASSADELEGIIEDHSDPKPKKKGGAVVAKKKHTGTTRKTTARKARATTRKNSTVRKVKSKPAVQSRTRGKAKRSTAGTNGYVPKGGRNLLEGVDFNVTDGWNAREGSAPSLIIAALKKARGNRERAFDALVPDVWDFVGKVKLNGERRTKAEAHAMLRYRISRTLWDFAMRTEQHDKAENRVEYGTGGTGQGVWKPAKRNSTKAKTVTRKAATRKAAGRKTATKARTKTTARKAKTTTRKAAGRKRATSRR